MKKEENIYKKNWNAFLKNYGLEECEMKYIKKLTELGINNEVVKWMENFPTLEEAWQACDRGDWMLWLVGRLSGHPKSQSRKKVVLTACECARLSLKHVPEEEKRSKKAIETAERWANGDSSVSLDDVRRAAYTTAYTTADSAAYTTADSAAYWAASAAYSAASAAYLAVSADKATLKKCAEIVRKHYPKAPVL